MQPWSMSLSCMMCTNTAYFDLLLPASMVLNVLPAIVCVWRCMCGPDLPVVRPSILFVVLPALILPVHAESKVWFLVW
jgi:hypothetical protein